MILSKQHKIIVTVIIGLVVLIGFTVTMTQSDKPPKSSDQVEEPISLDQDSRNSLEVAHRFENGQHTVSGALTLPDPCHKISNEVLIAESFPEQVTVNLTTSTTSDICAQVITDIPFEVSYVASEKASLAINIDGEPVRLIEDYGKGS